MRIIQPERNTRQPREFISTGLGAMFVLASLFASPSPLLTNTGAAPPAAATDGSVQIITGPFNSALGKLSLLDPEPPKRRRWSRKKRVET
jgi:hypothetical protein